jgi:ADP-ribose pyrophosphatase YjhB (NUDIX family)
MPGGGLDDHEEPEACVLREVAEETSQLVELGPLSAVQTSHWIGRNPDGLIEDFQAVRLVYAGFCGAPTDPVVRDRDGTTRDARWVELSEWRRLPWTVGWWAILDQLLGQTEQARSP